MEIVNPQDAVKESAQVEALLSRAQELLKVCGPCDYGLVEFGCTCSVEDPRGVVVDLLRDRQEAQIMLQEAFHVICGLYHGTEGAKARSDAWVDRYNKRTGWGEGEKK